MHIDIESASSIRRVFRKRGRRLLRPGIVAVLAAALVVSGMFLSGLVFANHNFSDVPTGAFYHNAAEWVFNRGITAGCAVGLYCPDAAVTRGQMAVFLRALGLVLTPSGTFGNQGFGAIDIDNGPGPGPGALVCMTGVVFGEGYPRVAILFGRVSILGGPLTYKIATIVSTDSGATWAYSDAYLQSIATANNDWAHTNYFGDSQLNVGTNYLFAIEVSRLPGTPGPDPISGVCTLNVAVFNRNSGTPPLAPALPITPQQKMGR